MKNFLVLSTLLFLSISQNLYAFIDNDLRINNDYDILPKANNYTEASVATNFLPFETVISHLSPYLESKFDLFILVNTATNGSNSDFIRYQNLRIFQRIKSGAVIFPRNLDGSINLHELYDMPYTRPNNHERAVKNWVIDQKLSSAEKNIYQEVPISSGTYEIGIQTYSGIFRVNDIYSKQMYNPDPDAAMSYSVYIDHTYADGRMARLAIHGTPVEFELFGRERSSHGCIRTHPDFARKNYQTVFANNLFSNDLPAFDKTQILPNNDIQNGNTSLRPGYKVLILLFNGYNSRFI